jgi:hypothetical protein
MNREKVECLAQFSILKVALGQKIYFSHQKTESQILPFDLDQMLIISDAGNSFSLPVFTGAQNTGHKYSYSHKI